MAGNSSGKPLAGCDAEKGNVGCHAENKIARFRLRWIDPPGENGNQLIHCAVGDGRCVGDGASILRIPRVVGKVKLIKKVNIALKARLVCEPVIDRQEIPPEQVVLFWLVAPRQPILDRVLSKRL